MRSNPFLVPAFAVVFALFAPVFSVHAQSGDEEQRPAESEVRGGERRVSELQAREVIEQLKTMRAQLLLEQEYNRLLEVRVERAELEAKLGGPVKAANAVGQAPTKNIPEVRNRVTSAPPRLTEAPKEQVVVKAVTVSPFKEAIVVYRGRVYTVRPGDSLGDIKIIDVQESGIVTSSGRSTMGGQ